MQCNPLCNTTLTAVRVLVCSAWRLVVGVPGVDPDGRGAAVTGRGLDTHTHTHMHIHTVGSSKRIQ